jgi:hypothetical protein
VSRLALERVRKLQLEEEEREKGVQQKHDAMQVGRCDCLCLVVCVLADLSCGC